MKRLLVAMLLTAASACAQDCPVKIKRICPFCTQFRVAYTNASDKQIEAVKFGAEYINRLNEVNSANFDFVSDKRLKAGKTFEAYFKHNLDMYEFGHKGKARVWPIKVAFSDGTEWQDSGNKGCAFQSDPQ